jgi:hypothetical protein
MRVGSRGAFASLLALPVWLAILSCSPDLRGGLADYHLLVFPGEAELGGSAAAVIGSNYTPGADEIEDYELGFSRVGIRIRDAADVEWDATVRSVFPLAAPATSRLAETRPGAWITVVLFDLPDLAEAPTFDVGTEPPFLADVIVEIDEEPQLAEEAIGSIRITGLGGAGVGGQPTTVLWPGVGELELDSRLVRFRPVLDTGAGVGFPQEPGGTMIAGLQADLAYLKPCFEDAEVYTGTEASDAGIHLGPEVEIGYYAYRRLVITHPRGFTLMPPVGGAPDALGEGPLIEAAFDRPSQGVIDCEAATEPGVWLWNVYAVRPDGSTIVDQRGTGVPGESSDLFAVHAIMTVP